MGLPTLSHGSPGIPDALAQLDFRPAYLLHLACLAKQDPPQSDTARPGSAPGGPSLPLLFILAIDPLQCLLQIAIERELLSKLNGRTARIRASMYADDAVIFLKPTPLDVDKLKRILLNFGEVTGLQTNLQKTSVTPISCDNIHLGTALANLLLNRAAFPIKYLGLPLTPRRLRKIDFQPLFDKAAGKLSTWNDRNLTQAGRASLVKSVLSLQSVYLLTVIKPTKEVLLDLDKICRRFLWAGDKSHLGRQMQGELDSHDFTQRSRRPGHTKP